MAVEAPVVVKKVVTPVLAEAPVAVEKVVTPVVAEAPVVAAKVVTPVAVEAPMTVEKVVTPVVAEVPTVVAHAEQAVQVVPKAESGGSGGSGISGVSGIFGFSGDEAPDFVTSAVPHVAVETTVDTAVKVGTNGTTRTTRTVAPLPLEGVAEKPVVVERVVTPVVAEVPVAVATSATLPLEETAEKLPKDNGVRVADDVVVRSETTSSDDAESQVIDFRNVLIQPTQGGVDGVANEKRILTPAQVLVDAASAVADTITVSPEVLRGASEIEVQLRSDVLEGTVIRISTTDAGKMNIQFTPVTAEVAALLEKCAPQLVAYLSERVHGFSVSVNVKRDEKLKG